MAVDVQSLVSEANCYVCFIEGDMVQAIKIALIARSLLALNPSADVTPQSLISYGHCYACFTNGNTGDLIELSLLDQISQAM